MAAPHYGGGGGSNPQTVQFLSSVLSQRGPSGLPYTEDVRWLIRMHLLSLADAYPSLSPKTATFTHNDGRSVNLLQADGTVPMTYHSVTYNIPVIIWLTESYPRYAPCVYVNPTRDMLIKQPHPYLDSSGLVRIPYLQNWNYPSSNLAELARNLSSYFERDPPLYSQRTNPSNHLTPNPNPNSRSGGSSSGRIFPGLQQQKPPQAEEDPNEAFRSKAISKIIEMANGHIVELRKKREEEMDALVNVQQALRRRGGEVDQGLKEMRAEMEALEQQLQMILMNTDVLESWLGEENEAKLRGQEDDVVSVDQAFESCDALSKQMLECACSDLAIEDVLYSLDKAVQDGTVPFEVYLRNVRLLSREQFFSRALGAKVKAAQMHSQVESMAARIHQFVG